MSSWLSFSYFQKILTHWLPELIQGKTLVILSFCSWVMLKRTSSSPTPHPQTGFCCMAQPVPELAIFLPQPSECWDYRHAPPYSVYCFGFILFFFLFHKFKLSYIRFLHTVYIVKIHIKKSINDWWSGSSARPCVQPPSTEKKKKVHHVYLKV
jgi:hypothetical protein